jgi:hypothetical protein
MGRTSIPCSDETRDELSDLKPEGATWDEFLLALADVEPFGQADSAQLVDEINSLRRELDEFKHQVPRQVAEELR